MPANADLAAVRRGPHPEESTDVGAVPLVPDGRCGRATHPAIVEARQVREAMRKSLHALGLPNDPDGDGEE